ncbi:MAG: SO_0444 family Cu/Zn efflux transporter [Muribaculaceae bacterium]|nr:SO_0444 family Cu/Zn efflux transporter [Muribaculaceae bacterium]
MEEILHLINEMSPYLLLGFLFAGILHAFMPKRFFTRYLGGNNFKSVFYSALLGVPLPLCSCGVIPTAMSLRKEGASRGATTSFLIATPQTGVDSIVATAAMMGIPFAIIRPVAAFITALFGGTLVNLFGEKDAPTSAPDTEEEHCCCCHGEQPKAEEEHCCCCHGEEPKAEEEHCCCCHSEQPKAEEEHCCHCEDKKEPEKLSFADRCRKMLKFAFVDMVGDIGKWLVIGLVVAAIITVVIPDEYFTIFKDNTLLSMLLVLAISIPMYICATGSIPIAVALMAKGLTPGAALVLLMAGPAANFASIIILRKRLGVRSLICYLAAIIIGAIACGYAIDLLMPHSWFTVSTLTGDCCHDTGNWFQWSCTGVLTLLLVYALGFNRKKACCCND